MRVASAAFPDGGGDEGDEGSGCSGGWHGEAYAARAGHHRALDAWFLGRHPPGPADRVIDAGCGTGEFTAALAGMVPRGHVIGVEPDPSMRAVAAEYAGPNLEVRPGRLEELDGACAPGSADLVVSRAAFHWIPLGNYPRCYAAIRQVLHPGGWFHAESGGAGNVARVTEVLDDIATRHGLGPAAVTFPHAGFALELLEQAGFRVPEEGVLTVAQRRPFSREQLLGFVRTQAAMAYVGEASPDVRGAFLADVDRRVDELRRHDGSYDQTFVRLTVRCQRPV